MRSNNKKISIQNQQEMLISALNKEFKGKKLGIAKDNKQFNELKKSDCDIIYHQNKGNFYNNLNGESKGLGAHKRPIAKLGKNYGLSYEDMPKSIPYKNEPIRFFVDAREFLEVMGVKKANKIAGLLNENPAHGLKAIEAYADSNNFIGVLSLPSDPGMSPAEWWAYEIYDYQADYYSN